MCVCERERELNTKILLQPIQRGINNYSLLLLFSFFFFVIMSAPNRFKPTTSPSALVLQGKEVQFEVGLIAVLTTSQSKGTISKSTRNT